MASSIPQFTAHGGFTFAVYSPLGPLPLWHGPALHIANCSGKITILLPPHKIPDRLSVSCIAPSKHSPPPSPPPSPHNLH